MDLPRNQFKLALGAGQRQFGLWLNMASGYAAEISAGAGFDWLVIDAEHAPNTVQTVLAQVQALAAYPVHPIVRIAEGSAVTIKQMMDIGVQTILVPMVEGAGQARELARAMRYPPRGIRGVASSVVRASRWNRIPGYLSKADAEACLIVQIETQAGLTAIEEIAAIDGVDALFIGPSDLAASMGHLGNSKLPEVQRAVEDGIRRICKAGKPAGILATDESLVRRYLDLGCSFVGVGLDASLLCTATQELAARYRPLKDAKP
ncbi:MAG TPA: aldolase/citrate lyase family protein [Steroidobacteraceae bacterium]|nr:aldolase/citrate lyase family protein [Steroidobacteraceae bacterium]